MTLDVASCMKEAASDEAGADAASNETRKKEKWIVNLANSHIGNSIVHLLNSLFNVSFISYSAWSYPLCFVSKYHNTNVMLLICCLL